jgi:hypothetical protein
MEKEKDFEDVLDESLAKTKIILEELRAINAKKETLEKAAERLFKEFQIENPIVPNNNIGPFKLGFIKGAKWEQERNEENKLSQVTRLEVINHAENYLPIGRVITLYKKYNDFNKIDFEYQDDGKTLKIFIS